MEDELDWTSPMVRAQHHAWAHSTPDTIQGALRGETLPSHTDVPLIKACIISGILHHPSFASSAASLYQATDTPEFTRALNARAIMSNSIPTMALPRHRPYCIWYPDVASEDTYRQLAQTYPQMRYQVARACAVAGYTDLYRELDVLPEVAVAEEARDNGSTAIWEYIMAQPVRYKVMDDYYRKLHKPVPSCLNGDTCVLSVLKRQKQRYTRPRYPDDTIGTLVMDYGFKDMRYDILEDGGITDSDSDYHHSEGDPMIHLLTSPLPADLPPGNKDLLILSAAFHGNVDRYARLRRPVEIDHEVHCVVRGIYHIPLFAHWWSTQQRVTAPCRPYYRRWWDKIQMAITARHIMNNDLSRIPLDPAARGKNLPYLIWYPRLAHDDTYRALARRVPEMREACVRAAIYANNVSLFDELLPLEGVVPNAPLKAEAEMSGNPYFMDRLFARAEELSVSMDMARGDWKMLSARSRSVAVTGRDLVPPQHGLVIATREDKSSLYNGLWVDMDRLDLYVLVPEELRPDPEAGNNGTLDYKEWPPGWQ